MVKLRASCSVTGKAFSPARFRQLSSVTLTDAHEPGELGTVGIYRGKPTPYGAADIEVSSRPEADWRALDALLSKIEAAMPALKEAGAENLRLICSIFHDGQCNFGFSPDQLERIAALQLELPISCYSDDMA